MGSIKSVSDQEFSTMIDGEKPVIIDFWAEWCGPCRAVQPVLEKLSGEYSQVNVLKMNVDENQETPAQFGIRSIPTIILFNKGQEVDRVIGASSPMLKNLFEKGIAL